MVQYGAEGGPIPTALAAPLVKEMRQQPTMQHAGAKSLEQSSNLVDNMKREGLQTLCCDLNISTVDGGYSVKSNNDNRRALRKAITYAAEGKSFSNAKVAC